MNKEIKMLKKELKKREIIKKYKNLLIIYSLAIGKRMPDLVSEVQLELQELRNK